MESMHHKQATIAIDCYDVYEVYSLLKKHNIDVGKPILPDSFKNYTVIESKLNTDNITFNPTIRQEVFLDNCNKLFGYYHDNGPITDINQCIEKTNVNRYYVKKIIEK